MVSIKTEEESLFCVEYGIVKQIRLLLDLIAACKKDEGFSETIELGHINERDFAEILEWYYMHKGKSRQFLY